MVDMRAWPRKILIWNAHLVAELIWPTGRVRSLQRYNPASVGFVQLKCSIGRTELHYMYLTLLN